MYKHVILLSAVSALLFSCAKEPVANDVQPFQALTFNAVWADSDETRTVLQSDGTSIWWSPGDMIRVYYGEFTGDFVSTNTEPQALTTFKGSLTVLTGTVEEENANKSFWAVYPYDNSSYINASPDFIKVSIPSEQRAIEGSFSSRAFPAVAVSSNLSLAFYNVCGGVRFSVSQPGITSITFKSEERDPNESLYDYSPYPLAGSLMVHRNTEGKPIVHESYGNSRFPAVTIAAPLGGFVPGNYYFAAFRPGTLREGLIISLRKANQSASFKIDGPITINRSRFGMLDEIDSGLDFIEDSYICPELVDLGLSVKWASFNLGATKPEESGYYYAWGETNPKDSYTWETYNWCNGGVVIPWKSADLIKYCDVAQYGYNGYTDDRVVLDSEDDAASVHLGDKWRIPTREEWVELMTDCTWTSETVNSVSGYRISSKTNGNSIFLPAIKFIRQRALYQNSSFACASYWSSSLSAGWNGSITSLRTPDLAYAFDSYYIDNKFTYPYNRVLGLPIRPVCD
jgi:hypothetical protein